jgi:Helix-turn-helix family
MDTARRLWTRYEPIHSTVYFAEEAQAALAAAGYRGYWMRYFALRAAPLGPVGPAVVTAVFYGFAPSRVRRALPDAWSFAAPERALQARLAGADAVLRRVWGEAIGSPELAEAAALTWEAAQAAEPAGRVLGAANQALPAPDQPHLRLWQAATTLREHRGDSHTAALVAAGIGPVEAHVLKQAAGETDAELLRTSRNWPDQDWERARAALAGRGWLDPESGRLTAAGAAARDETERRTDEAAAGPWAALGPQRTGRLAALLTPLAQAVIDAQVFPVPNPVGVPAPG